jgi:hypothetical protein
MSFSRYQEIGMMSYSDNFPVAFIRKKLRHQVKNFPRRREKGLSRQKSVNPPEIRPFRSSFPPFLHNVPDWFPFSFKKEMKEKA